MSLRINIVVQKFCFMLSSNDKFYGSVRLNFSAKIKG
jgi:hypothetical protein